MPGLPTSATLNARIGERTVHCLRRDAVFRNFDYSIIFAILDFGI